MTVDLDSATHNRIEGIQSWTPTCKHSETFHGLAAQVPSGLHVDGSGEDGLFITCEEKQELSRLVRFSSKVLTMGPPKGDILPQLLEHDDNLNC